MGCSSKYNQASLRDIGGLEVHEKCPEMTHTVEPRDGLGIEHVFAGDRIVFMALEVTTGLSVGYLRCQAAIAEEAVLF